MNTRKEGEHGEGGCTTPETHNNNDFPIMREVRTLLKHEAFPKHILGQTLL